MSTHDRIEPTLVARDLAAVTIRLEDRGVLDAITERLIRSVVDRLDVIGDYDRFMGWHDQLSSRKSAAAETPPSR